LRRFSLKAVLTAASIPLLIFLIYWHFIVEGKGVEDIIPNIISDIVFAIFIVLFIEYANERDLEQRNRSRRRAGALAVQKFYQNIGSILGELVREGAKSSGATALPTADDVKKRAEEVHAKDIATIPPFSDDPIPYAAFFITKFSGKNDAGVYPPRPSATYVGQCANEIDSRYVEVFRLDSGLLPDDVVDALTKLKHASFFVFLRHLNSLPFGRFGYWPETELREVVINMQTVETYFGAVLGYKPSSYKTKISDFVTNALVAAKP
jgi:hypothetical protein